MKITDVLLRLLTTEVDKSVDETPPTASKQDAAPEPDAAIAEPSLPTWVRLSNEHGRAADKRRAIEPEHAVPGTSFMVDAEQEPPAPVEESESDAAMVEHSPVANEEELYWPIGSQDTTVVESAAPVAQVEDDDPVPAEREPFWPPVPEEEPVVPQAAVPAAEVEQPFVLEEEQPFWPTASERPPLPEPPTAAELEDHVGDTARPATASLPDATDFALEFASRLVETRNLGYHLGSAIERIAEAAGQGRDGVSTLYEATWLIVRYIEFIERRPVNADAFLAALRAGRTGDATASVRALAAAFDGSDPQRAIAGAAVPTVPERPSGPTETLP